MNNQTLFNRQHMRRVHTRAAAQIADHNFLINWNLQALIDRLDDIRRTYPNALLLSDRHSDDLVTALRKSGKIGTLTVAAPVADATDHEILPFEPETFDLIISPFSLHALNDVPGALIQIRHILKPDGLFLGAFPGGETLIELRQSFMDAEIECRGGASLRVHPFADKQQAAALMQRAGFSLPVVDSERLTVTYDNAFRLMQDLRRMGETNALEARQKHATGKNLMLRMAQIYQDKFTEEDGRIRATFEMLFMTGWSPHESQQQPLRPGSAQSRLAAALGTEEIGTGDMIRSGS